MPLTTLRAEKSASADALTAIQDEISRLSGERAKLHERREALRRETLASMADAFARKLQAAGFSVREGIQALRPYEKAKLEAEPVAPRPVNSRSRSTGPHAPAPQLRTQPVRQQSGREAAQQYAQRVLGAQWQAWMDNPNVLLGGERPRALLDHPSGVTKVLALLDAYEQST